MDPITYSLTQDQRNSDRYYAAIAVLADSVLAEASAHWGDLVPAFMRNTNNSRTVNENYFELLALGVLWRVYGPQTATLGRLSQRTLAALVQMRQCGGKVKQVADHARGVLGTLLLTHDGNEQPPAPTLDNLDRLLDWLDAAGEFNEEVKRFRAWQAFFHAQPPGDAAANPESILGAILTFAESFEARSLDVLGEYTAGVESFLTEKLPDYKWREDRMMAGRQRVEYHLNMVGTEIMNRAFRERFLAAEQKIVLVPPCMRAKPSGECKAVATPFGDRCMACTPTCRVHQATKLGEKHGFQVLMLPHELSVFSNKTAHTVAQTSIGIVGVSCALTNITGGWRTRDLGVPAQGVLLDYVGCVWHWHKDGIPTSTNFRQLLHVMGIEDARETQEVQNEQIAPA